MDIDRRVRFTSRLLQRRSSTKHMLPRKILILAHLLNTRLHSPEGTGGHDREVVLPLLGQLLELSIGTDARLQLLLQLRDDGVLLARHIGLELGVAHLVLVLGLQGDHHAAEVLADELGEQLRARVAVGDVARGEDLVGELGAGFEGEGLGEHERVVAVEEEGRDLGVVSTVMCG